MKTWLIVAMLMSSLGVRAEETSSTRLPAQTKDVELARALELARMGKYEDASMRLFRLALSPQYQPFHMQIKYILGLMLLEMKLYQAAAFQFVDVVKEGNSRYVRDAIAKLALAADALDDDTLLNYALSRVQLSEFPAAHKEMLYYRVGEYQYRRGNSDKAIEYLKQVPQNSAFFARAKYLQGTAYAEANRLAEAELAFTDLYNSRLKQKVTDPVRNGAVLGLARVFYQKKDWDKAIEFYRQIPRDSEMWHEALFEMSWAFMRSARFRSVLSNFHSLHSPFYDEFFIPESVLLRSIVYLYICQYDEMDKTLNFFEKQYTPVLNTATNFIRSNGNPTSYFNELEQAQKTIRRLKEKPGTIDHKGTVPFSISKTVLKEGDVQRSYQYLNNLRKENQALAQRSAAWKAAPIGRFTGKIIAARTRTAETRAGRLARVHMIRMVKDLRVLFEQHAYSRYEMLNSKKEQLKKKLAQKGLEVKTLDQDTDRSFYVQNGYEYWPFQGEYWLDEIGNFYYLGTQRCE